MSVFYVSKCYHDCLEPPPPHTHTHTLFFFPFHVYVWVLLRIMPRAVFPVYECIVMCLGVLFCVWVILRLPRAVSSMQERIFVYPGATVHVCVNEFPNV